MKLILINCFLKSDSNCSTVLYYLPLRELQQGDKVLYLLLEIMLPQLQKKWHKFLDQVKINLISQLINDTLKVLQKLITYFNSTDISAFLYYEHQGFSCYFDFGFEWFRFSHIIIWLISIICLKLPNIFE